MAGLRVHRHQIRPRGEEGVGLWLHKDLAVSELLLPLRDSDAMTVSHRASVSPE